MVVEKGARWPAWLETAAGGLVSIFQGKEEPTLEFHERAERCVRALSLPSQVAVMVCAGQSDGDTAESRRSLLVALVAHLELGGGGKLVLMPDGDYAVRQSLAELALELSAFLDDVDSPVSCRLRAQPRKAA